MCACACVCVSSVASGKHDVLCIQVLLVGNNEKITKVDPTAGLYFEKKKKEKEICITAATF